MLACHELKAQLRWRPSATSHTTTTKNTTSSDTDYCDLTQLLAQRHMCNYAGAATIPKMLYCTLCKM
ncbi:hypothetical protein Y032_0015g2717 [Ancylostoma ceylanicum]|uniref:Uncharacterized protein n=1 Tax=Ancylostoma ceylanicum TaxID=53326 RepID=A0A016V9A7_9BILA|nr:hypothetical protein Y032_0015g2717 [Ancylostoma ceylanicum]